MHHPSLLCTLGIILAYLQLSLPRRHRYQDQLSPKQAGAARLHSETLAPVKSKRKLGPLELEAEMKWEDEVAAVQEAIKNGPNLLKSRAWRAAHGVKMGVEWQGSTVGVGLGKELRKNSLNECFALCNDLKDCVAWSWHRIDKHCYTMSSCTGRLEEPDTVSGRKASLEGAWVYYVEDQNYFEDFGSTYVGRFRTFYITAEKNGEMTFENDVGEHGKLQMTVGENVGGYQNDVREYSNRDTAGGYQNDVGEYGNDDTAQHIHQTMDEWEAKLGGGAGTMRLRLTDESKITLWSQLPEDDQFKKFTAEKKEACFEPYDRVTIKEDQVITAADIWVQEGTNELVKTLRLKKGSSGTVDNVCHPRQTGVNFDQDPAKTVWVNDALLVKTSVLKGVREEEVKYVFNHLEQALVHAIQDPITLEVFRDPVIASDGYTYERSAIEQLITGAEEKLVAPRSPMTRELFSSIKLSANHAMRSLVASVIEKVDASRTAAGQIQKHYRGYQVRKGYAALAQAKQAFGL